MVPQTGITYIQPLIFVCAGLALLGLTMVPRSRGRTIALLGVGGFLLFSWGPVDWLLSRPLEGWYPVRPFAAPPGMQAIVIPGSTVDPPDSGRPYVLPDKTTFDRCEYAAWIYHRCGPLPVLACGGAQKDASSAMRQLLRREGVPDNMIWTEDRSWSTHENAKYGAEILRSHGVKHIILVVEAVTMPRAAACFRKEGLDVAPAPMDFRAFGTFAEEWIPNWRAIRRNEMLLHEVLGLVWYKLRGWI